ncbi:hypothetical protein BJ508DRAFT_376771 [Ascobolus immersus RN42]|uniref:Uncharacterized protein n=1 Tax=Ascobolus immersus RN42 TaxID=1160509 RepID=A0A3N4I9D0_ASCIM|nr:hypothetical protein BJ508DRAFT_376771 [Ascobolus immersus RN42]
MAMEDAKDICWSQVEKQNLQERDATAKWVPPHQGRYHGLTDNQICSQTFAHFHALQHVSIPDPSSHSSALDTTLSSTKTVISFPILRSSFIGHVLDLSRIVVSVLFSWGMSHLVQRIKKGSRKEKRGEDVVYEEVRAIRKRAGHYGFEKVFPRTKETFGKNGDRQFTTHNRIQMDIETAMHTNGEGHSVRIQTSIMQAAVELQGCQCPNGKGCGVRKH